MKNDPQYDNSPEIEYYLERHEGTDFIPRFYPDWTEKQWKAIWHNHAKFLKEKEKKVVLQIQKKKREEVSRQLQIATIARVISIIARMKQVESNKQFEALYSSSVRTQAIVNSGNTVKSLQSFERKSKNLDDFEDSHLVYLLYILFWREKKSGISKANRFNIVTMKKIFSEVMIKRGLPISQQELKPLFEKIPPERINEYFKMFGNMNLG